MTETDAAARGQAITTRRVGAAFGWGMVATLVMSALMITAVATGVSPMPKPIPAALVGQTVGPLPKAALLPLALATHLVYGGLGGAALACLTRRIDLKAGLLWGGGLWAVAGLIWLPYLDWGAFGLHHTAAIAVATLVLHLVYGAALGWLADRYRPTP